MVPWHGLFTAAGVVVSAYAARHYARRFGFAADIVWTLLPYVALAAIVGGRLEYVGAHLAEFRLAPLEALRIDRGGLGSFGALIGALAALVVFARVRRLPTWRLADALAIAIPINYLSMRVGNFLIGELYGDLAQGALIVFLVRRARSVPFDGFLFWWTLFYVSVIRFAVDLLRSEWRARGFFAPGP